MPDKYKPPYEFSTHIGAACAAPDLLISDVWMPGLSVVDLAAQIKAECPEGKILLFSGPATTQNFLKDASSQDNTFQSLQKPVHQFVMLKSIGAVAAESPQEGATDPPDATTHRNIMNAPENQATVRPVRRIGHNPRPALRLTASRSREPGVLDLV